MKKINALLHDVTVIDFKLVAKLTLRYRFATKFALAALVVCISYFYFTQLTVHTKKIFFKVYAQEESSGPRNKLSDFMEDSGKSFLNHGEVMAIISSYDFTYALAEKLVKSKQFSQLDFNSTAKKTFKSQSEIFYPCVDKTCLVKRVQEIVPGLFSLDTEITTGRFMLTVTTRSALTTMVVIENFRAALDENRYKEALKDNENQTVNVQKLIEASREGITAKGGFSQLAPSESMEALIQLQQDKLRSITQRLSAEVDQLHFQQIRFKESESTAKKDINGHNKLEYENYSKIVRRIEGLRQNIAAINSTPVEARSPTDTLILNQLISELKTDENELVKIGRMRRNVSNDDKFIDTHINNQTSFEFDLKVSSEKVKKLRAEAEAAKKELDDLYTRKSEFDSEHLTLKPDLEYLKLMESKLVSLKMLSTAIKSDVVFDQFGPEVRSFKRNSLIQIIIFSMFFIGFLLFISLIVIYLFDDRIHDEFEILKCFDNLQVIGPSSKNKV